MLLVVLPPHLYAVRAARVNMLCCSSCLQACPLTPPVRSPSTSSARPTPSARQMTAGRRSNMAASEWQRRQHGTVQPRGLSCSTEPSVSQLVVLDGLLAMGSNLPVLRAAGALQCRAPAAGYRWPGLYTHHHPPPLMFQTLRLSLTQPDVCTPPACCVYGSSAAGSWRRTRWNS